MARGVRWAVLEVGESGERGRRQAQGANLEGSKAAAAATVRHGCHSHLPACRAAAHPALPPTCVHAPTVSPPAHPVIPHPGTHAHMQLCYYQALEFAIERGLQRVEAGAQGEHKMQRVGRPRRAWLAASAAACLPCLLGAQTRWLLHGAYCLQDTQLLHGCQPAVRFPPAAMCECAGLPAQPHLQPALPAQPSLQRRGRQVLGWRGRRDPGSCSGSHEPPQGATCLRGLE